jgi:sulfotransferase
MAIEKVFYNSSLPRAGSTLIQNILGQNPTIHTTPTSGLYEMLSACRTIYTDGLEFKAQDTTEMETGFKSFLKNGLYSFYENLTDRPYVVDKCRGWGSEYEFINAFDSKPKIICMIRDVRAIYSSLEKKYRQNPLTDHHIANWGNLTGTTTDKRMQVWSANPPIGPAMDRLYQILVQGIHQHVLFIKFEELCIDPDAQMRRIYEYLELPYYKHDFDNIPQYTKEDDKWYGIFGDHMIRGKLKPVKNDFYEVLGPNACRILEDSYKWFFNDFGYQI